MALKENYKDDMFEGSRRWRVAQNSDGTSTIADATTYTQKGDKFGANDINDTNKAVNRINHTTPATLTVAGWSGSAAPYSQTVSVAGVTADMEPILVSMLADSATLDTQKAYNKALAIICAGTATTGAGKVTFKVYKKPVTDITIGLKGV